MNALENGEAAVEAVNSPMVITACGDVPMSVQAMKTPTELRRSLTCRPALCDTGYIVCSIGCQDCVGEFAKCMSDAKAPGRAVRQRSELEQVVPCIPISECGRLDDEHYRHRWERKLKLYAGNGFTTYSTTNLQGRLIVTQDGPEQGLDSKAIEELARKLFAS
jgi:hypothetical protein